MNDDNSNVLTPQYICNAFQLEGLKRPLVKGFQG